MQRRAKFTLGVAAALAAAFTTPGARAGDEQPSRLPPLPSGIREDCWLRAPPGEPASPCEIVLGGGSTPSQDRAVLVRERGGARRRGVAIQIRGGRVELFGAGRGVGSVGADLGWMRSWAVLHNRDAERRMERDVLLLSPAAPPGTRKLPASVLLVQNDEAAEMRWLDFSPPDVFAAIGLADPRRRFIALDLLEESYDVRPVKALLLPGLDDTDELVRLAVAQVLAASKVTEATETIASWLGAGRTDVSPFMRGPIAIALGELKSPTAEPALEGVLTDEGPDVRRAAVCALGELGLPAAAPLIAARVEDPEADVRREAVATLRLFKEPDTKDGPLVRALRKAFADPDQRTRLFAVQTATKLELRTLVPAFIERLHDADDEVQYAALLAVAKFRAREAAPHIVPLLKVVNARIKRHDALCWSPSSFNPVACTAARTLRDFGDAAGLNEAKKVVPYCLEPARSPSER